MKTSPLLFILLSSCVFLTAQRPWVQHVEISNGTISLVSSNIGHISGDNKTEFYIEQGDTIYRLYGTQSVWAGGVSDDTLSFAGAFFNMSDFYPGPISSITTQPYLQDYVTAKSVWRFSRSEIENLIDLYEINLLTIDDIPEDVLSYPGRNNEWYLEEYGYRLREDLAPFYDRDGDQNYNPLDGDYPVPLAENPSYIPVEFSYTVYNDLADAHSLSNSFASGVEVQQICYVDRTHEQLLDASYYTRLVLKNKSYKDFSEFYFAVKNDLEHQVGGVNGFYEAGNGVYFYGPSIFSQLDSTAIYFVKFLSHKPNTNLSFLNPGISPGNQSVVTPELSHEFINYCKGFWRDGTPLTYGGLGFNPGSTDTVEYQFPDFPFDEDGWSDRSAKLQWADYHNISSFNLGEFDSGEEFVLDFSTTLIHDFSTSEDDKIRDLEGLAKMLDEFYTSSTNGPSTHTLEVGSEMHQFQIIPNPAKNNISIDCLQCSNFRASIYNANGQLILNDKNVKNINIQSLKPGLYIMKIHNVDSGESMSNTFVKI